jgi:hypothetical protein
MKKQTLRALLIIIGLLVLLFIAGVGSALWLVMRSFDAAKVDSASAAQEFDRVRSQFGGVEPLIAIRDEEPVITRKPPAPASSARLTTMHVLAWDAEDDDFVRLHLPFWLLRLKSGPIEIMSDRSWMRDDDLGITVDELERHGPTLVLDHRAHQGTRVMVWTE